MRIEFTRIRNIKTKPLYFMRVDGRCRCGFSGLVVWRFVLENVYNLFAKTLGENLCISQMETSPHLYTYYYTSLAIGHGVKGVRLPR